MSKIEIHDIKALIDENYPPEMIKNLLDQVLKISILVKNDYPDYKNWYLNTQIPGLYDNTRNIIIAHIKNRIVGFVSLKKTKEEKKICTFYVEKSFRKNQIGTILVKKANEYLETDKPLITIPLNKLNEFTRIGEKYNWEISDIKENLYRLNNPEVIVNGNLEVPEEKEIIEKSLKKTWRIYKISRYKQKFNYMNYFKKKSDMV